MKILLGILGVVAMLALVFAGGFVAGRRGPGPNGSDLFGSSRESALYAEIAAHPFWRVKVTAAQVRELVEKIRAEKRDTIVFVDDQFVVGMNRNHTINGFRMIEADVPASMSKPDNVGKRFFYLDLYRAFADKPSAEVVAEKLLALVKARDYRG